MSYDLSIKVLLIGNSAVGKSSFLNQLVNTKFSSHEQTTLGVEFRHKFLNMNVYNTNYKLKCQIWDTSGSKKLEGITKIYYTDCAIIFIFYDITNKQSFDSIYEYVNYIKEIYKNVKVVIIGTKTDLYNKRTVSTDTASKFSHLNNFNHYELSCTKNNEVNEIFYKNINKLFIEYLSQSETTNHPFQGIKKGPNFNSKLEYSKDRECCYIS